MNEPYFTLFWRIKYYRIYLSTLLQVKISAEYAMWSNSLGSSIFLLVIKIDFDF